MSQLSEKPTHRRREDWMRLMAEYESADITQRAFCTRHGLAYSSFCYWRKRLRDEVSADSHSTQLIELPVLSVGSETWRVELKLGDGIVLRLK